MPRFGSNDEFAVQWHLPRVEELGLLEPGEVYCEVEGAAHGSWPGVLVVTDLKVIFVTRSSLGRKTGVIEIVLSEIVEARSSGNRRGTRGKVTVVRSQEEVRTESFVTPVVLSDLGRFGVVLGAGEVAQAACQGVWLGWRVGRLLVTDARVIFAMGGILWRHRAVLSFALDEIAAVSVSEDRERTIPVTLDVATREPVRGMYTTCFGMPDRDEAERVEAAIESVKAGDLLHIDGIVTRQREVIEPEVALVFERIRGGEERATQIARTIMRQKEHLERRSPESPPLRDAEGLDDESPAVELPPVRVTLGRGVASWVNDRGGLLYVWGDPFGDSFDVMKASPTRPEGVEFERSSAVTDFELFLESEMVFTRPMHIGRRWFGLRSGLAVNTGLIETAGI